MRPERGSRIHSEELVVYGLLVLIGLIPVVLAVAEHAVFGAEVTLGLLMTAAGMLGVLDLAWRAVFRDREP